MVAANMLLSVLAKLEYIWLLFLFKVELEHEFDRSGHDILWKGLCGASALCWKPVVSRGALRRCTRGTWVKSHPLNCHGKSDPSQSKRNQPSTSIEQLRLVFHRLPQPRKTGKVINTCRLQQITYTRLTLSTFKVGSEGEKHSLYLSCPTSVSMTNIDRSIVLFAKKTKNKQI